jgi:DNA-binding transcriptional MerR regulator
VCPAGTIQPLDEAGVALAAIQGLNIKVESGRQKAENRNQLSEARIQKLEAENVELKNEVSELKQFVQAMSRKLNGGAK